MRLKRKIIRFIGFLLIVAIAASFLYILLNHEDLRTTLSREIEAYGPIGLVISGFVIDLFGGPIGPEVSITSGLLTGMSVGAVVLFTFLGSIIGTLVNYAFGRFVLGYGAEQALTQRKFEKWQRLFIRHRRISMLLGALTPVPYEVVCILAGIFKVRLTEYIIFTIGGRFIRITGAAYIVLLFQGGY